MRKAFGEIGGLKVSQAVLSLSKMSKAIKKYILFIYSALHIFYMTRKYEKKKKNSEDPFCSLQTVFVSLPIYPCDAIILFIID